MVVAIWGHKKKGNKKRGEENGRGLVGTRRRLAVAWRGRRRVYDSCCVVGIVEKVEGRSNQRRSLVTKGGA